MVSVQLTPLPSYLGKQEQLNDPAGALMHLAFSWQLSVLFAHSSTSASSCKNDYKLLNLTCNE